MLSLGRGRQVVSQKLTLIRRKFEESILRDRLRLFLALRVVNVHVESKLTIDMRHVPASSQSQAIFIIRGQFHHFHFTSCLVPVYLATNFKTSPTASSHVASVDISWHTIFIVPPIQLGTRGKNQNPANVPPHSSNSMPEKAALL